MVDANASGESFHWPPLESNPEIFADYMKNLGMPANWTFGELFGFEEELLAMNPQPCVGVIIASQRLKKTEDKAKGSLDVPAKWYMKQTEQLDNACGIIAAIHAIANNRDQVVLESGCALAKFLDGTVEQSPADRATTLENDTSFQQTHKSFAS